MKTNNSNQVSTEQERANKFIEAYTKLCKEWGFQLAYAPVWVQSKDTGDYRLQIQVNIAPLPKET